MSELPIIGPERLEYIALADLVPHDCNARTHSKKQLKQIADSITRFGFTNPVLVDGNNLVVAGHGRIEAARLLGMTRVPVLLFEHMTEAEKRAYVIADNRLAELAGWDNSLPSMAFRALLKSRRSSSIFTQPRAPDAHDRLVRLDRAGSDGRQGFS